MKEKLMGRLEWKLILAALLVLGAFFLLQNREGPSGTAHITIRGEQVLEFSLDRAPDQIVNLWEYGIPASLEIRFVNVTCPDHICEKTGWVWQDGQSAVCMPNRTAVVIVGE